MKLPSPYVFPGLNIDRLDPDKDPFVKFIQENRVEELIMNTAATHFNITSKGLISKSRKQEYVNARNVVSYVLRAQYGLPYSRIGNILGGKNHATVMHGIKVFKDLYPTDRFYRERCDLVFRHIGYSPVFD